MRLLHFIDGKELLDTPVAVGEDIIIPSLYEDMYIVSFSWDRTFIPHQIFKNKMFDKNIGDQYSLTKAFYVLPSQSNTFRFKIPSKQAMEPEEIELMELKSLELDSVICPYCTLTNQYWALYNGFFDRKDSLIKKLNLTYYEAVKNEDPSIRTQFLKVDSVKSKLWTDEIFHQNFQLFVANHSKHPISTFFVFYQLYTAGDFEQYLPAYQSLTGDATKSKYYKMIQNQYKKLKLIE